jgi:hypothetical protein
MPLAISILKRKSQKHSTFNFGFENSSSNFAKSCAEFFLMLLMLCVSSFSVLLQAPSPPLAVCFVLLCFASYPIPFYYDEVMDFKGRTNKLINGDAISAVET